MRWKVKRISFTSIRKPIIQHRHSWVMSNNRMNMQQHLATSLCTKDCIINYNRVVNVSVIRGDQLHNNVWRFTQLLHYERSEARRKKLKFGEILFCWRLYLLWPEFFTFTLYRCSVFAYKNAKKMKIKSMYTENLMDVVFVCRFA